MRTPSLSLDMVYSGLLPEQLVIVRVIGDHFIIIVYSCFKHIHSRICAPYGQQFYIPDQLSAGSCLRIVCNLRA